VLAAAALACRNESPAAPELRPSGLPRCRDDQQRALALSQLQGLAEGQRATVAGYLVTIAQGCTLMECSATDEPDCNTCSASLGLASTPRGRAELEVFLAAPLPAGCFDFSSRDSCGFVARGQGVRLEGKLGRPVPTSDPAFVRGLSDAVLCEP
jgi:hypothetical protein